nr:immunoglobulin heavy chain junction region [Macaca mulatta]
CASGGIQSLFDYW